MVVMAGPCSVENRDMILSLGAFLKGAGAHMLRGGAFKPRTSPYAFQGLGVEGLRYLAEERSVVGLPVITEVMDTRDVEMVAEFADILQVGARNMQNFNLLKVLGRCKKPVMLKRGLASTLEELLMSAEYVMSEGNTEVILCERGIRTFEKFTRNTLDLSAVPVLKRESHLPVVVDPEPWRGPLGPGGADGQGGRRGGRGRLDPGGASGPGQGRVGRAAIADPEAIQGTDGRIGTGGAGRGAEPFIRARRCPGSETGR